MAYNITSSVTPQSQSSFYGGTSAFAPSGGSEGYSSDDKQKKPTPSPLSASNVKTPRQNVAYVNGKPAFVNGKPVGEFQNRNLAYANGQIYSTTSPDSVNLNNTSNIVSNSQSSYTGPVTINDNALSDVRAATQLQNKIENSSFTSDPTAEARSEGLFLSVRDNNDGTYNIQGPFGTDLGNLSFNPQVAYDATMPLLNYAANMQSYDTGNQIIQGAMSFGRSFSAISPQFASIYDGQYVSDFLNATDMAYNWNNRNAMENALSGINTITGIMSKLDLGDVSSASQTVQNGLALYNFGNSVFNLVNNWEDMTPQQRVGGLIGTTWAGTMAYMPAKDLINNINTWASGMGAGAAGAANAGTSVASNIGRQLAVNQASVNSEIALNNAANAFRNEAMQNTNEMISQGVLQTTGERGIGDAAAINEGSENWAEYLGDAAAYAAFAYSMYDLATNSEAYGPQKGRPRAAVGTGANYSALTAATMAASNAAGFTSFSGPVAAISAAVAFAVGYGVGMVSTGHSKEQAKRTAYEKALIDASVFDNNNGSYVMQLADGRFYTLLDGSGKRATDIDGNKKTVYDESKIVDRNRDFVNRRDEEGNIRAYLQPYDIDYTSNLDFTSSIMGKGLLSLALGSNYKGSGEMDQMLGYIVNGVTSNTGRDWTRENFNNAVANLRAAYARTGISTKRDGVQALVDAYFSGAITESDYKQSLMGLNFIYDENGFDQANQLMDNMGRNTPSDNDTQTSEEPTQQQIMDEKEQQLSVMGDTMGDSTTVSEEAPNSRLTPEELELVSPEVDTTSVTVDVPQGDLTTTTTVEAPQEPAPTEIAE